MGRFFIRDDETRQFKEIIADRIKTLYFGSEKEFKIFIESCPSCNCCNKRVYQGGTIEATFILYFNKYFKYWSYNKELII